MCTYIFIFAAETQSTQKNKKITIEIHRRVKKDRDFKINIA